jgi:CheY-like chemotaxis protein
MKLPLYHRPSALVFLDDEVPYLEMLALVLPRNWLSMLYSRSDDFVNLIAKQANDWEKDLQCHRGMIDRWHAGAPLPPQVVNYWQNDIGRFGLSNIAVVDYAMPSANGLDVIQSLPQWPAWRILLTGQADEQIAIDAFNHGLIHRFMTKQTPDLGLRLIEALRHCYLAPLEAHESLWHTALRVEQLALLKDSSVQQSLKGWLDSIDCVEYFTLPEPFGLLALDQTGRAHWLQIEQQSSLDAAAEIAAAAGCNSSDLASIRSGEAMCNAELVHALGGDHPVVIGSATRLDSRGDILKCHFPLEYLGQIGSSHTQFLAECPRRGVDPDDDFT